MRCKKEGGRGALRPVLSALPLRASAPCASTEISGLVHGCHASQSGGCHAPDASPPLCSHQPSSRALPSPLPPPVVLV